MTREQHLELMANKMAKNLEIAKKKNQDYCGKGEASDPFKNFRLAETLSSGVITTEMSIFTRMTDKVARIGTLLGQEAQVSEESIQDALGDLSNYALILSNYLDSKKTPTMDQVKAFLPYDRYPDDNFEKTLNTFNTFVAHDFISKDDIVKVIDEESLNFNSTGKVFDSHFCEDGYENQYVVKIDSCYVCFSESQISKVKT